MKSRGALRMKSGPLAGACGTVLPFRDTGNTGGEDEGEFSSEYLEFDWPVRFPNEDV